MKIDYYAVLGVDSTATAGEIKRAYKKLAHKYHPDKQSTKSEEGKEKAEEAFKQVEEAYRVLKDPIARAHFDQTGSGKLPKSKDMAVKKIIELFAKYIKEALEAEMEQDLIDEAMVRFGLKGPTPSGMDVLIENVRLELVNERDKTEFAIGALQKGVKKLNKYKRKVLSKSDTNLYLQVIEQQLDATQGALAAGGIKKIALETALAFLDDYEYGDIVEDPEYLAIPGFLRNQDNLAEENKIGCQCEESSGEDILPLDRCDECPRWQA